MVVSGVGITASGSCTTHRDPFQLPAVSGAAGKLRLDDSGLGHAKAVLCDVNGRAGGKLMVAGGEGIPVGFFLLLILIRQIIPVFLVHPQTTVQRVLLRKNTLIACESLLCS